MTGVITGIEDAVTTRLQAVLGTHVRDLGSLPGPWSTDLLRRMFQRAPACYVSWLGGRARRTNEPAIDSRMDVLVVTKNARGEAARRRGDGLELGAYDLLETVIAALHGHVIDGTGTLTFSEVRNVFNEATFDVGATVYAIAFTLPVEFAVGDWASLDDFLRYREDLDMAPADATVDIETDLDLPGPP